MTVAITNVSPVREENGGCAPISPWNASDASSNRPPLDSTALTSDSPALTAIDNGFRCEEGFARQIAAFGRKGDIGTRTVQRRGAYLKRKRAILLSYRALASNRMGKATLTRLGVDSMLCHRDPHPDSCVEIR